MQSKRRDEMSIDRIKNQIKEYNRDLKCGTDRFDYKIILAVFLFLLLILRFIHINAINDQDEKETNLR